MDHEIERLSRPPVLLLSAPELRGNRLGKAGLLLIDCVPGLRNQIHAFMPSYPLPKTGEHSVLTVDVYCLLMGVMARERIQTFSIERGHIRLRVSSIGVVFLRPRFHP